MIITRTPYRISFFGGGTDYPEYYLKEGGAVLSATINKYCYISCRRLLQLFNTKHRVAWSHVENVSTIGEILHPAVREGLRYLGFDDSIGININYIGDMPARTGMGSSSAFAVGLIKALYALRGETISKQDLAVKAIELERDVMKECVGSQDQIAAAYGGLNLIQFSPNGEFHVEEMPIPFLELSSKLMLFYTGTTRLSSDINKDMNILSRIDVLREMHKHVAWAIDLLNTGQYDDFGKLLNDTWLLKRQLSNSVSNPAIDAIYDKALGWGALGGKLLGAGVSGFMVFYVPEGDQASVREALTGLTEVPFQFERDGSTLIYYDAEDNQ